MWPMLLTWAESAQYIFQPLCESHRFLLKWIEFSCKTLQSNRKSDTFRMIYDSCDIENFKWLEQKLDLLHAPNCG